VNSITDVHPAFFFPALLTRSDESKSDFN